MFKKCTSTPASWEFVKGTVNVGNRRIEREWKLGTE